MNSYKQTNIRLLLITGLLSGFFVALYFIPYTQPWVHESIVANIILQAIVALALTNYHVFFFKQNEHNMVNAFLGSTLIRLLLSIGAMAVLLLLYKENRLILVVNFFLVYLYYMVFEIKGIISNLRAFSRK